jgi:predicted phage replisome organizer
MSTTKKYFWLKLRRDFFKRHDTKIIESMDNGKDYLLFYLKLLVESIDHEGNLRFSDTIPYNEKMLSVITDTNIDIVRSAVKVFTELGMMEQMDDGTLFMAHVKSMIGSESSDAIRMREIRDRNKQLLIEHDKGEHCSKPFKNRSPELEKDIDTEIDTEIDKGESPNGFLFPEPEKEKQKEVKQPNYDEIEKTYFTNFLALHNQGRLEGDKPILDKSWYPKIRKRVKAVAAIVPEEKIVHAINAAMSDDWIVSQGYSLLTILADTQLNKLINGKSQPAKTGMIRQRTAMLDMPEA